MNITVVQLFFFTALIFVQVVLSTRVYSADCDAIFPDAISNSKNSGKIQFYFNSKVINSLDNIVDTVNLIDGAGTNKSCDGISCSKSNLVVPEGDFNSFPNGSNISIPFNTTLVVPPGNYGSLTVNSSATLELSPGLYTFRKAVKFLGSANLKINAFGSVQFMAKNNIVINSSAQINQFGNGRYLFMFARNDFVIGSSAKVKAVLYARDDVTLSNGAAVEGAITARDDVKLTSVSTVTFDPSLVVNQDFGNFCTPTLPAALVANWQLEQSIWDGSASEVVDSGVNALNGRAIAYSSQFPTTDNAIPALSLNPGTCRYGQFDGTNDGHLRIEDNNLLDLDTALSVTAWINPASFPSGSNLQTIASKDENWEFHTNSSNEIFWWWGGGVQALTTTGAGLSTGNWYHLAVTYKSGQQKIYINGVEKGSTTSIGSLTLNSDPVLIGTDLSFNSRNFNGLIDEVRVYDGALTQSEVVGIYQETHPCPLDEPDHYAISFDNTPSYANAEGLTCEASSVWIYSHNALDMPIAPGVGASIALATSSGEGYWSNPSAGSIVDLGNGDATYTFAANDSVELKFNHVSSGAVNFDVDGGNVKASEDPTLTLVDTGFRFVDNVNNSLPNQVAELNSADIYLQAVRLDSDTSSCTGLFSDPSTHDVRIGAECNNPLTCAGEQISLTNNNVTQMLETNNDNTGPGAAAYTHFSALLFGADSKAVLTIKYPDVGAISLHAEHDILNEDSTDSGVDLVGSSNVFVVKPHTMFVSNVSSSSVANPGTTTGNPGFIAAGIDFAVQVEARNAVGDRTPNFGNEIVAEDIKLSLDTLVYPVGGSSGTLNNASSFAATTPAGTFEKSNVQWTEVGTMTLLPELVDDDYLGAGDLVVKTASANIGRFYPQHFKLITSHLSNTCSAGNFSYMSEPLSLNYTLQAQSALADAVVTNYDNTTLVWDAPAVITYQAEDNNSGTELNIFGRFAVSINEQWDAGELVKADSEVLFSRRSGVNPEDGPYMNLDIGLQLLDPLDARLLQDLDMNSNSANDCVVATNCSAIKLGSPLRAYFGRMHLKDAFGPETADIPMFWQNEYWNGSRFIVNQADSCAALPVSNITFTDSTAVDNSANTIAVTNTAITSNFQFFDIANNTGSDDVLFTSGMAGTVYSAPNPVSQVSYQLGISFLGLGYLSGDWDQDGLYNEVTHPDITVRFSHYRGNDRIIYWRELLQ